MLRDQDRVGPRIGRIPDLCSSSWLGLFWMPPTIWADGPLGLLVFVPGIVSDLLQVLRPLSHANLLVCLDILQKVAEGLGHPNSFTTCGAQLVFLSPPFRAKRAELGRAFVYHVDCVVYMSPFSRIACPSAGEEAEFHGVSRLVGGPVPERRQGCQGAVRL